MMKLTTAFLALGLSTGVALADDVTDALAAAQEAYAAGNLNATAAQITAASKAVLVLQAAKLAGFLPEAPAGWTREIDMSATEAMALSGIIGNMVEARYSDAAGNSFTLSLTADSPMVAQMGGMLGNPQMMAMMGKLVKIGGHDMLEQENSLSALIGGRVLVQASGMASALMQTVLGEVDFAGLARYDS